MKITVLEKAAEGIKTHPFAFDPTYGLTLEKALKVETPAMPDDFADFWTSLYERSRNVATRPTLSDPVSELKDATVHEIAYDSLGGQRIHGWLTLPRNKAPRQAFVLGHGYGSRTGPDVIASQDAVSIFPCARGLGLSPVEGLEINRTDLHVLHGIESRGTYIHGGCAADFWAAASALEELFPDAAQRLVYAGGSFGGGMGALFLPWDRRFKAAALGVPSFGNHPLRVTLQSQGSNQYVRARWLSDPAILDVLKYFDAALAAKFMTIPVQVWATLFDPAVPPPGQFAVLNALAGPRELILRTAGHFPYPHKEEEDAVIGERMTAFFDQIP